jgi:deoxycytidine triphosphate deaminase
LSSPCEQSYAEKKSKYMNQQGPQSSKIKLD